MNRIRAWVEKCERKPEGLSAVFRIVMLKAFASSAALLKRGVFLPSVPQVRRRRTLLKRSAPIASWAAYLILALLLNAMLCGAAEAQNFRAAASAAVASGVTALTITKPAGTVSNDVMIAAIAVRPNTATITAPSGWTLVRRTDQSTATAIRRRSIERSPAAASRRIIPGLWAVRPPAAAGGIMTFYNINTRRRSTSRTARRQPTPSRTPPPVLPRRSTTR